MRRARRVHSFVRSLARSSGRRSSIRSFTHSFIHPFVLRLSFGRRQEGARNARTLLPPLMSENTQEVMKSESTAGARARALLGPCPVLPLFGLACNDILFWSTPSHLPSPLTHPPSQSVSESFFRAPSLLPTISLLGSSHPIDVVVASAGARALFVSIRCCEGFCPAVPRRSESLRQRRRRREAGSVAASLTSPRHQLESLSAVALWEVGANPPQCSPTRRPQLT